MFDSLVSDTLKELYPDGGLTSDQTALASEVVVKYVERAYNTGLEDGVSKSLSIKKPVSILVLAIIISLLLGTSIGVVATPNKTLPTEAFFLDGAPLWEIELSYLTPDEAATNWLVVDAVARMGSEWQFVGVVQYRNMLMIRAVNLKTQIMIYVYKWTPDQGWVFFAEEFQE